MWIWSNVHFKQKIKVKHKHKLRTPTGESLTSWLLHILEELNLGPPKTNPSHGKEEDLNPGPPDYKSSTLPLGHPHLQKIKPGQPRGMALTIFHSFSESLQKWREVKGNKMIHQKRNSKLWLHRAERNLAVKRNQNRLFHWSPTDIYGLFGMMESKLQILNTTKVASIS